MNTIADDIRHHNEILERSSRANHFLSVARALMAAQAHQMPAYQYAEMARLGPDVAQVLRAGVSPPTTASAAALYSPMVRAFTESLRVQSAFDRMWPYAAHANLHPAQLSGGGALRTPRPIRSSSNARGPQLSVGRKMQ